MEKLVQLCFTIVRLVHNDHAGGYEAYEICPFVIMVPLAEADSVSSSTALDLLAIHIEIKLSLCNGEVQPLILFYAVHTHVIG